MPLVPVTLPHGALALALVLPGPVGLLAVLAAVGRVPAAPVDCLRLALVTLETRNEKCEHHGENRGNIVCFLTI